MKNCFKKAVALVTGVVMAASISVSAFAGTSATSTGKYAQFLKANNTSAASMVQDAVVYDYTSGADNSANYVTYDADEEKLYINVQKFYISMTIPNTSTTVSGWGYINSLTIYDEDGEELASGVVKDDLSKTSPSVLVISNVDSDEYDDLVSGTEYTVEAGYDVEYTSNLGNYNHNNSTAVFKLVSSPIQY